MFSKSNRRLGWYHNDGWLQYIYGMQKGRTVSIEKHEKLAYLLHNTHTNFPLKNLYYVIHFGRNGRVWLAIYANISKEYYLFGHWEHVRLVGITLLPTTRWPVIPNSNNQKIWLVCNMSITCYIASKMALLCFNQLLCI